MPVAVRGRERADVDQPGIEKPDNPELVGQPIAPLDRPAQKGRAADAGLVDIGSFTPTDGNWQSGAGLGLRYETGFGPIRLDLATPLQGDTGAGFQLYVGLGQAF